MNKGDTVIYRGVVLEVHPNAVLTQTIGRYGGREYSFLIEHVEVESGAPEQPPAPEASTTPEVTTEDPKFLEAVAFVESRGYKNEVARNIVATAGVDVILESKNTETPAPASEAGQLASPETPAT